LTHAERRERIFLSEERKIMVRRILVARIIGLLVGGLLLLAAPAVADPGGDNPNAVTRTLSCDNGRTVAATFAGEAGSNFNVSIDQSVFIYKRIVFDRVPLGPGGDDETDDRGIQAFDPNSLVTCTYTTPSGTFVTVIGFFTPRA
jgi:hypothetical protein